MATAQIGALRAMLAMNVGEFIRNTRQAAGSLKTLERSAKATQAAFASIGGIAVSAAAIGSVTRAYMKQAEAVRLVEATIRTTGGAAGFSSEQLQRMASDLQKVSTFGDEEILRSVTNNLLTFGNVVGPTFDRAQKAAINLSTVLQQDLKSSAIQLGKALNNPLEGINALNEIGIKFTIGQKEQVRQLLLSNKVMEAQGVILKEVEKFYGGAAKAAADGSGAITQAGNALGDVLEKIGEAISPEVIGVSKFITATSEAFQQLNPDVIRFVSVAGTLAVSIGALGAAFVGLKLAIGLVSVPILATVAAVSLLGAGIYTQWQNIKGVATAIGGAFQYIYDKAKAWLVDNFGTVIDWFQNRWNELMGVFRTIYERLGLDAVFGKIVETTKQGIKAATDSIAALKDFMFISGDEMEKAAPELGPRMVKPIITAAERAELAKNGITEAAKEIIRAQQELVNQGVQLAEGLKTPYEEMQDQLRALKAAHDAGKISGAQFAQAQVKAAAVSQNAYASMASGIVGDLESAFGKSKAISIAQALINTYQSVTNAMANIPAPFNIAAAGAALAAGMAQVANIRSTSKTGGGGGGRGAGSVAPSSPPPAAGSVTSGTAAPEQRFLSLNLRGSRFSAEDIKEVIDQINELSGEGFHIRGVLT